MNFTNLRSDDAPIVIKHLRTVTVVTFYSQLIANAAYKGTCFLSHVTGFTYKVTGTTDELAVFMAEMTLTEKPFSVNVE